jgi:hypothetical protein
VPDPRRSSFATRYLDPASHMGEILFGLIMTLTFTLAAGIVIEEEGREGAREMLIGILGCNLAWGIIDGVLYVLGRAFERGRIRRIGFHVREATTDEEAHRVVAGELDASLEPMADETARNSFYTAVVKRTRSGLPIPNAIRKEDVLGGLAAGWVVFACSFPALLPFLFIDDLRLALRVSNAILIGLLFFVGWRAALHTLVRPWLSGLVFMLVGVLLVAVAIPLGG